MMSLEPARTFELKSAKTFELKPAKTFEIKPVKTFASSPLTLQNLTTSRFGGSASASPHFSLKRTRRALQSLAGVHICITVPHPKYSR